MPSLHVVTVTPNLPVRLLDHVLTAIEQALNEAGATRVWISADLPELAVMADLPKDDSAPSPSAEGSGLEHSPTAGHD